MIFIPIHICEHELKRTRKDPEGSLYILYIYKSCEEEGEAHLFRSCRTHDSTHDFCDTFIQSTLFWRGGFPLFT